MSNERPSQSKDQLNIQQTTWLDVTGLSNKEVQFVLEKIWNPHLQEVLSNINRDVAQIRLTVKQGNEKRKEFKNKYPKPKKVDTKNKKSYQNAEDDIKDLLADSHQLASELKTYINKYLDAHMVALDTVYWNLLEQAKDLDKSNPQQARLFREMAKKIEPLFRAYDKVDSLVEDDFKYFIWLMKNKSAKRRLEIAQQNPFGRYSNDYISDRKNESEKWNYRSEEIGKKFTNSIVDASPKKTKKQCWLTQVAEERDESIAKELEAKHSSKTNQNNGSKEKERKHWTWVIPRDEWTQETVPDTSNLIEELFTRLVVLTTEMSKANIPLNELWPIVNPPATQTPPKK